MQALSTYYVLRFVITILNGENNSCKVTQNCAFDNLEFFFAKGIERFKLVNTFTWCCVLSSKNLMKRLKSIIIFFEIGKLLAA